jgi:hypothetical protein
VFCNRQKRRWLVEGGNEGRPQVKVRHRARDKSPDKNLEERIQI